jgi:hypothetical protein
MTPSDATEKQIEIYRRMTGEQRLLIGLRLHELSCNIAREGIRAAHPDSSDETVERILRERIALGYSLRESGRGDD